MQDPLRSRLISILEPNEKDPQTVSDADDTLGGRLLSAREMTKLSTAQLARRIGVKTDTLSAWENDRDEPRANKLVTMAGILNVAPTWLLCGTGDGPSSSSIVTEMLTIRSSIERLRETMIGVTEELEKIEKKLECYDSHRD